MDKYYKREEGERAPSSKELAAAKKRLFNKFMDASIKMVHTGLTNLEKSAMSKMIDLSVNLDLGDGRTLGIYIVDEGENK